MLYRKECQLLDPRLFKAFMAAAETENFTSAATKANMTQSGVSQHIAKLEEQIGLPLFKRIGKRVIVTDAGKKLEKYITEYAYSMNVFLDYVHQQQINLSGLVSYAMPPSCLMSPHFPQLLEKRKKYPGINLKVTLAPSHEVIKMVLNDQVDFGFITRNIDHPLLSLKFFCQEEYILVGSDEKAVKRLMPDNIPEQRFIHYPGVDVYYDFWLRYHCRGKRHFNSLMLSYSGHINSLQGAITMVAGGLGYGVFPRHCVQNLLEKKVLFEYLNTGSPSLNDISIVKFAGHTYPRRVEQVIQWFFEMKEPAQDRQAEPAIASNF